MRPHRQWQSCNYRRTLSCLRENNAEHYVCHLMERSPHIARLPSRSSSSRQKQQIQFQFHFIRFASFSGLSYQCTRTFSGIRFPHWRRSRLECGASVSRREAGTPFFSHEQSDLLYLRRRGLRRRRVACDGRGGGSSRQH